VKERRHLFGGGHQNTGGEGGDKPRIIEGNTARGIRKKAQGEKGGGGNPSGWGARGVSVRG